MLWGDKTSGTAGDAIPSPCLGCFTATSGRPTRVKISAPNVSIADVKLLASTQQRQDPSPVIAQRLAATSQL